MYSNKDFQNMINESWADIEDNEVEQQIEQQEVVKDDGFEEVLSKKQLRKRREGIYLKDKHIKCRTCSKDFLFSASKQLLFINKKWNDPKTCEKCKKQMKNSNRKQTIDLN